MFSVKDITREKRTDPQLVYRAIYLIEAYQNYDFKKQGRSYRFNETEKRMITDVLENGVAAAKKTREYRKAEEVIM